MTIYKTNESLNKTPHKPNKARRANVGNVATSTQKNPSSEGDAAIRAENVRLPDPMEELSKVTKERQLAERDADAAHNEHVRFTKILDSLQKDLERADEDEAEVVKRMIMEVTPKVENALLQAKDASDLVASLKEKEKEAAEEVKRATEEISNNVPPKKTDPTTEYLQKLPGPKTARVLPIGTTHRQQKTDSKSTHPKTVTEPPAPTTFEAAIGVKPLIDRKGNINATALADPVILEKGLAGRLRQIAVLQQAMYSTNADIQKFNEQANDPAPQQIISHGTPSPAVQAAKENLKVLEATRDALDKANESAKKQFLDMFNGITKVGPLELDPKILEALKSPDFVKSLADAASAAQHGSDAQFFKTIAFSCLVGGTLGFALDSAFSRLTSSDLELRYLAHGASTGMALGWARELWGGNLAGVSDSSKVMVVGLCMATALWALDPW